MGRDGPSPGPRVFLKSRLDNLIQNVPLPASHGDWGTNREVTEGFKLKRVLG